MRDKQAFEAYVLEKSKIEKKKIALRRKTILTAGMSLCICLIALVVLPGIWEQTGNSSDRVPEAWPEGGSNHATPVPTMQNVVGGIEDEGDGASKEEVDTENATAKPSTTPGMEKLSVQNLMIGFTPKSVVKKEADNRFINSTANFSIALLQQTYANEKNTLVSPLSVLAALTMTANGADGDTLAQMEQTLGGLSVDELNGYLKTFFNQRENTDKVKLTVANSIWFRDDADRLAVKQDFLQKNADYYGAAVYKAPFDEQTVKDINQWVKKNTDGMIKKVVDEISPDTMLYLINTLVFDGEWQVIYERDAVREGIFTNINDEEQSVKMMHSKERRYLDDGMATGFIKNYAGGQYSFVALLPNEGVSLSSYVASLSGESFRNTFLQAKKAPVYVAIPKFSYDCDFVLNDGLQAMGMKNAFNGDVADFSAMGQSSDGNLYIGNVIHKTFISVDERGTKAGAVTSVEMNAESSGPVTTYTVHLDRPFVYAIVDNATGIPVFMGTVVDLG